MVVSRPKELGVETSYSTSTDKRFPHFRRGNMNEGSLVSLLLLQQRRRHEKGQNHVDILSRSLSYEFLFEIPERSLNKLCKSVNLEKKFGEILLFRILSLFKVVF